MVKTRKPMHVDPEFEKRMKELQRKIMKKNGENVSLRELTKMVVKTPDFEVMENRLLGLDVGNINLEIKFDKRLLRWENY